MRLLNVSTLRLEEYKDSDLPPYAILSHTWLPEGEVAFADLQKAPVHDYLDTRLRGSANKIIDACSRAGKDGHEYMWIDTCCIDKSSSAELTESINSMYRWYKGAANCYAYLEDVNLAHMYTNDWHAGYKHPDGEGSDHKRFDLWSLAAIYGAIVNSRYFSRAWIVQEILASTNVEFCDRDWESIGTRASLAKEIEVATGIKPKYLNNWSKWAPRVSAATKFSWMARTSATREEDRVYALLGLTGQSMDVRYGDGESSEFMRLQRQIIESSDDESIFAWKSKQTQHSGLLAPDLDCFRDAGDIHLCTRKDTKHFPRGEYSMTNGILRFPVPLQKLYDKSGHNVCSRCSKCRNAPGPRITIPLNCWRQTAKGPGMINVELQMIDGEWQRVNCHRLSLSKPTGGMGLVGMLGGQVSWTTPIDIPQYRTTAEIGHVQRSSAVQLHKHRWRHRQQGVGLAGSLADCSRAFRRLPRLVP